MVRQCHSNTCPVGICTQDEALRAKFTGSPEKVIHLFTFIAEEVREILAALGARTLQEVVGRTEFLAQVSRGAEHLDDLDLNPLLVQADPTAPAPVYPRARTPVPSSLDEDILKDAAPLFERGEARQLTYAVRNTQRAIGARVSSAIVRRFGPDARQDGLADGRLTVQLSGAAGQSLGAFGAKGLRIELVGEANDYVGKGLSGATIAIRPSTHLTAPGEHALIGSTCLYGATSGRLYAAGKAGERFAVRNSGASAVIEGCGTNGCEYMTGGEAVILGAVGANFAAGMTGGHGLGARRGRPLRRPSQPGERGRPPRRQPVLGRPPEGAGGGPRRRDRLTQGPRPPHRLAPRPAKVRAGLPEGDAVAARPAPAGGGLSGHFTASTTFSTSSLPGRTL